MRLGTGILVALVVCGALPVAVLGFTAERVGREEVTAAMGEAQGRLAAELARGVERFALDRLQELSLASSYIPFDRLAPADLSAALVIPYRQVPGLEVVALLDASGKAVAPPVHGPAAEPSPGSEGREPVDALGLEAFARAVPLRAALEVGAAIGPPYLAPSTGIPRVALAVRVGTRGDRALVAELSLAELVRRLSDSAGDGVAYLLDRDATPLAGVTELSLEERDLASGAVAPRTRILRREDGEPWLASWAPVESLGWGVVVAVPAAEALGAVDRLRRHGLYWAFVALAVALLVGVRLSRALARPVERLTDAARALTEGRFDAPVPEAGPGELGSLAEAFAHMAREVRRRDEEIRGWNAELESRVESKSAELREAEVQLERSRRLTALGALSAGVAHGLNNPLTSVVGIVSLVRAEVGPESEAGRLLRRALDEARRVTRVVHDLRRMAEPGPASGLRRFPPAAPAGTAVERLRPAAHARKVTLAMDADGTLPLLEGDPDQIETLVERLVENAIEATPGGGGVRVALSSIEEGAVRLTVEDTGRGIPGEIRARIFDPYFSTRREPGAGVGLTVAHGIVEAHHGRISVESEEGRGSRFTVILPAASTRPDFR